MLAFDDFHLDPVQKRLLRGGDVVPVQPKVFDLLLFFVERPGQLLSHDALMTGVWADTYVGESTLTFYIHSVRKLLGDKRGGRCFIETVSKRGYRFVGSVTSVETASPIRSLHPVAPDGFRRFYLTYHRLVAVGVVAVVLLVVATGGFFIRDSNVDKSGTIGILPFRAVTQPEAESGQRVTQDLVRELSNNATGLQAIALAAEHQNGTSHYDPAATGQPHEVGLLLSGDYSIKGDLYSLELVLRRATDGEELLRTTVKRKVMPEDERENPIVLGVARALSDHLRRRDPDSPIVSSAGSAEAIAHYSAGQKLLDPGDLSRRSEMVRHFQLAIDLAPEWAPGYSGLAEALVSADQSNFDWDRAEIAAQTALKLFPDDPYALAALAKVLRWRDRNWVRSEEMFRRSLAIDPRNSKTLVNYADLLMVQSRFSEARDVLDKALSVDPFSHQVTAARCDVAYFEQKYEEAARECKRSLALEPDFWEARKRLFWIFVQQKAYGSLGELILAGLSENDRSEHPFTRTTRDGGLEAYWRFSIRSRLKRSSGISPDLSLATHYMQVNDRSAAMEHLMKSFTKNEPHLDIINVDPIFAPLKTEARFREILFRIGLAAH